MRLVRYCMLLAMIARMIPVQAMVTDSIPWYGRLATGFGHDDVRNMDVGLISVVPSLKGVQVGLLGGGTRQSMSGIGIYGIAGVTTDNADGLLIGGFNYVGQSIHGLSVGGISIAAEGLHGVQIGGINIASWQMKGVQLGFLNGGCNSGLQIGVLNMTGDNSGVSIGGVNTEFELSSGLQLGGQNFADSLSGVQIGIFNHCRSNPTGVQIGIVNFCGEEGRQLGLVNINPTTRLQMLVTTGNHDPVNLALRIRNRHTYNVIGIGLGRKGWNDYIYSSAYYRIGQYFTVLPRLILSGDIGISDVAVMREGADAPDMFSLEARLNIEYEVHSKVSLFATAGYTSTRYVSDRSLFRRKPLFELGVVLF